MGRLPPPYVLVVDDDPLFLQITSQHLERRHGCIVTTAASGERALMLLNEIAFDVILCDYVLGGIDGVEVLKAAREKQPTAMRVLVTAHGSVKVAQEALHQARIDAFIAKGPTVESEIDEVLQKSSSRPQ